jgi:hypothetical protein
LSSHSFFLLGFLDCVFLACDGEHRALAHVYLIGWTKIPSWARAEELSWAMAVCLPLVATTKKSWSLSPVSCRTAGVKQSA